MTCIVGIVEHGKVYMAGDTLGSCGYDSVPRRDVKVFLFGGALFGCTSSYRMGQLLRYSLRPKPIEPGRDVFEWMCTDFVNAVRQCLREGGYSERDKERESGGGTFLVGLRGRLFKIENDFQVGESQCDFDACGCGQQIALGSLHTSRGLDPERRLIAALDAASTFSNGVRGPYTIERLDPALQLMVADLQTKEAAE